MYCQVLKVKLHGQEAALKLLGATNRSMSAKDEEAAERELKFMRSLRHPCIVQVTIHIRQCIWHHLHC